MKNEENKNKVLNDIEILLKAYSKKQSENFQKKFDLYFQKEDGLFYLKCKLNKDVFPTYATNLILPLYFFEK